MPRTAVSRVNTAKSVRYLALRGGRVLVKSSPPSLSRLWGQVGMLICADAYTPEIATQLKAQVAQVLVSAVAWGPGLHGPNGEWERCTRETGLPLLVCNRTGIDRPLRFTAAPSLVVHDGQRLYSFVSERSAMFLIEWDLETRQFSIPEPQRLDF